MKKKTSQTWNAVPKSKRKRAPAPKQEVSREELARAIQAFKEKGGLIRELPPESAEHRPRVGAHIDTGLESLFDN